MLDILDSKSQKNLPNKNKKELQRLQKGEIIGEMVIKCEDKIFFGFFFLQAFEFWRMFHVLFSLLGLIIKNWIARLSTWY